MAKLQYTPLQLVEEVSQTTSRNGMVVINLLSNGVLTSIAMEPRSAVFLAHDLKRAWGEAIEQRSATAEIVPFKRRA